MKKQQILLLVALILGALVVWGSTGLYASVGAVSGTGKSRDPKKAHDYDPRADLPTGRPAGRSFLRQHRTEERPPLPEIDPLGALPLEWVIPVPVPGPAPAHWGDLRHEMVTVVRAGGSGESEPADDTAEEEADEGGDDPAVEDIDLGPRRKPFVAADAAKMIFNNGDEWICRLETRGILKGQPVWAILEKWPAVEFTAHRLNSDGSSLGVMTVAQGEPIFESLVTVQLAKSLENEFHERRIRTRVKDSDQNSLVEFARWIMADLTPRYGVPAVELAITEMTKAVALGETQSMVEELGTYHRAAYDFDGELALYQDYLSRHSKDQGSQLLVGRTLHAAGAWGPAIAVLRQASDQGNAAATVAMGESQLAAGQFEAALASFERGRAGAGVGDQARALVGIARIHLWLGNLDEAGRAARSAKTAAPGQWETHNVLGSVLYCQHKYAEAAASFKAAAAIAGDTDTTARCNQGLAVMMSGDLEGAKALFESCLDVDPLNYFAPLVGLGDLHQRWGELTASNDYFDTALQRVPNDAWMLIRRGQTRLRDGLPDKALELGQQALAAATSSTDALRVVGIAAGSLAQPDHATAVAYLDRASGREPANMRLVYDLTWAMIQAGRLADASRLLDEVTLPNVGPGRQDAYLLAQSAYAMFQNREDIQLVLQKLNSVLQLARDERVKAWAEAFRTTILRWNQERIWAERFNRPASSGVGGTWKENEVPGPKFSQSGNSCIVAGSIERPGGEERNGAWLRRSVNLQTFINATAEFRCKEGVDFLFHLFTGNLPSTADKSGRPAGYELGVGVNRTGKLVITRSGERREGWTMTEMADADGNPRMWDHTQSHTIAIERVDDKKGVFHVYFDGERISPDEGFEIGPLAQRSQEVNLGFLVDGDLGTIVDGEILSVTSKRTVTR